MRFNRLIFRFTLAIFLSFLASVLLLEGFIRLFDPYGVSHFSDMPRYFSELCEIVGPPRIIRHKPNMQINLRGFSLRTNSLGLRGPDIEEGNSREREYRILFLGDSVLLGWGVDEKDHFLRLAEEEVNRLARNGRIYRFINSGHNQYDTTQEAALLYELGPQIKPDAVFLVYVNNDVIPTIKTFEELKRQAELLKKADKSTLENCLSIIEDALRSHFRGINDLLTYLVQAREITDSIDELLKNSEWIEEEGWARSRAALLQIKEWCADSQIPFIVLDHTLPGDDTIAVEIPFLIPFLEEECITRFPFHFSVDERRKPIRRSRSDAHVNALGHQMLLNKLKPALRSLGMETEE